MVPQNQDRTGSDWIGLDRTGPDRTGPDWITDGIMLEILHDKPKLSLRDIMERRRHWEFFFCPKKPHVATFTAVLSTVV